MNKLEKLIQQYCPDGVERKTFSEVFETITDYTAAGSFKNIADNVQYLKVPDYAMLIRTTDLKSNFIKGGFIYVSESAFNYLWRVNMDKECIVMPNVGNCGEIYYVQPKDLPYEHCALAPNAILVRSNTQNNRYLSYCLQVEDFQKQLKKITSPVGQSKFNKSELKKLVLPIPPLPVQEEIVRILDTFTELQAELQKRLQQYNYYRDNLLSVYSDSNTVRILDLQQCVSPDCSMSYGVVQPGEDFIGGIPVVRPVDLSGRIIHNKGIKTVKPILLKAYSRTELKGGELLVCVRGTTGVVAFAGEDLKGGNVTRGIVPLRFKPLVNSNYMYHLFNSRFVKKQIENKTQGAALQQINVGDLKKISIPIPPLEEQNRIVAILDRFDTLTNDLTSGLPAEMEKRRQQYEYYRDRLLTFKRL